MKTTRKIEINQARSKLNPVNRPDTTSRTTVYHHNGTEYMYHKDRSVNIPHPQDKHHSLMTYI